MKVLIISGSYPPFVCGVGDYTEKLVIALQQQHVEVEVMANIDFSMSQLFNIRKRIKAANADIIHIQFPSLGFKYGFITQVLTLLYKTVVTVHEVSQFHPVRKMWLLPFSFRSTLIFTSLYEYRYFQKIFPWRKYVPHVVPIGSNITSNSQLPPPDFASRDFSSIVYFGFIRPTKGLEDVIRLAALIKENSLPFKIIIIGRVVSKDTDYFEQLKVMAADLPVSWMVGLSEDEVAVQLTKPGVAYLPFPDGASERRGSLLAALHNQLAVYTTKGDQTPPDFDEAMNFVATPEEMVNVLLTLAKNGPGEAVFTKMSYSKEYLKSYEWPAIASKHIDIYRSMIQDTLADG